MKIEDKINKYLVEKVSRDEAYNKLVKVIRSSTTDDQFDVAKKMAQNFYKMYGEEWITSYFGKNINMKTLKKALDNQDKKGILNVK